MAESNREINDLPERRKNTLKYLQRKITMRSKLKTPTESRQASSTSASEGGERLSLTTRSPTLAGESEGPDSETRGRRESGGEACKRKQGDEVKVCRWNRENAQKIEGNFSRKIEPLSDKILQSLTF